MTTNIQRASIVSRHVNLVSLSLKETRASMTADPLDLPTELDLSLGFRGDYELPEGRKDHVYVSLECQFSTSSGGKDVCDIRATYLLVYHLQDADTFPEDALHHFAELNGAYNAWPYWRQLVQSTAADMGLNSIVLPVFRPPEIELEEEEAVTIEGAKRETVNS